MASRRPAVRGGRGSNQYQTKAGAPVPLNDAGVSPQDVAWVFDPDRDRWEQEGLSSWAQAAPWIDAGFFPVEAGRWQSYDPTTTAVEARAWEDVGLTDPYLALQWKKDQFSPDEFWGWVEAGFMTRKAAAHFRDAGMTVEQAAAVWDEAGFTVEQRRMSGQFPDPVECRQWYTWLNENYPQGDAGRGAAQHQAVEKVLDAGPGYDFDEVAARVLAAVKPASSST